MRVQGCLGIRRIGENRTNHRLSHADCQWGQECISVRDGFKNVWQRSGAFGRLGRLGRFGGRVGNIFGAFGRVWERSGGVWEHLAAL